MELSENCKKLLIKSQKYQPTYAKGRLAIHLPMSLIALDKMNATGKQLDYFYENTCTKLDLRKTDTKPKKLNYLTEALAKREFFESYVLFFKKKIDTSSVDEILKESLPVLIKGVSASAFHPLIRLSYAIEINDVSEIIQALASWSTEYLEFNNKFDKTDKNLNEIVLDLNKHSIDFNFSPGNIVNRMVEINNEITNLTVKTRDLTVENLRNFCIDTYYKHNNFTLLHTVTTSYALQHIKKYLTNTSQLELIWESIIIACLSTGIDFSKTNSENLKSTLSWDSIISKACTSLDEHIIKLVYVCWQEHQNSNNDKYKFVAERSVSKID